MGVDVGVGLVSDGDGDDTLDGDVANRRGTAGAARSFQRLAVRQGQGENVAVAVAVNPHDHDHDHANAHGHVNVRGWGRWEW